MKFPSAGFGSGFRRRAAALGACAAAAALASAVLFSPVVPRALDSLSARAHEALRVAVRDGKGVVFCSSLSAARPVNEASGGALVARGVAFAPDAPARRFRGRSGELFRGDVRWTELSGGGTVALRIRAAGSSGERRLVWDSSGKSVLGIRLLDGRLEAMFADDAGKHVVSGPFGAEGRFATVVLSVSPERVSLWLDGGEVAAAGVSGRIGMPPHAVEFSGSAAAPAVADLAAMTVWKRPLSPDEIRALPPRLFSVRGQFPVRHALAAAADFALVSWCRASRAADRLLPGFGQPAAMNSDFPVLRLRLSKADRRHFAQAHEKSIRLGFRTSKARDARRVKATFGSRSFEARLSLADVYSPSGRDARPGVESPAMRPAFLLRAGPGVFGPEASGSALLMPPERWGALHPDARTSLPDEPEALVRLVVDGDFRGLYVLDDADRTGSAWLVNGEHAPGRADRVFFRSQPSTASPGANGRSAEAAARAAKRVARALRSDPDFPRSGAEIAWRNHRHAVRRERLAFPSPRLSALDFIGGNPSPLYVVEDLDLAPAGEGVVWKSMRRDVVSDAGRLLSRPSAPEGTAVEMLAVFPDTTKRIFRFRVMPPEPILPALFLHVSSQAERDWRTDFTASRRAAGPEAAAPPELLSGTGDSGGGLHHRGNTSYVKGAKRSLSLEFDSPVRWAGAPEPVSHVLLLSGYADPTRLRNALSFHAFRALDPRNAWRCVPVSWTEVCVNGEYGGVWEQCPRLRDVVSADAASLLKVRSPDGLWTRVTADMTEDAMNGKGPVADPYAEFVELSRFVVESSPAEFGARWRDFFDEDNLADYWLLLNFTGNEDGKVTNQYIARRASDGRFVVCPWDYDKTFLEGHDRGTELSNALLARVFAADPGFRARCAGRWAAARRGPLSDAAICEWIDSRAAALAPAMGEEWRLLRPAGFAGDYAEAVAALRREVLRRASQLDARAGLEGPQAPAAPAGGGQ